MVHGEADVEKRKEEKGNIGTFHVAVLIGILFPETKINLKLPKKIIFSYGKINQN